MSDLDLGQLSETYIDVLKEIGNIGAGNAMTALAQMLDCKIDMRVPKVRLLELNEIGTLLGGEEELMVGIFLGVEGDISGSIMFLIGLEAAKNLVKKIMMGYDSGRMDFDEMESSAMQEISNIITGAYLNSLSTLTNLKIYPTPPSMAVDMVAAIMSVTAIKFGELGDNILLIQSQFFDDMVAIDGFFVMIPDLESYGKILSALGMM